MKLIVGLGNPDDKYKNTRHNIGFIVLDSYLGKDVTWQKGFEGLYVKTVIDGEKVVFLKPMTYMNESGRSVYACSNYFKIDPKNILVIHDDLDLPFLEHRLKINSSSGGHNGIKSIINSLRGTNFCRLKIGIGHSDILVKDYVLGNFSLKELDLINSKGSFFREIINFYIKNGIDKSMNMYN